MVKRLVLVLVLVVGCRLDSEPHHVIATQDAATPPDVARMLADAPPTGACSNVFCQPGQHVEVDCEPAGTGGCAQHCHCTCLPDVPCAMVDCGATSTCVQTCTRECDDMSQICSQACVSSTLPPSCEALTDEMACITTTPCLPVYVGADCGCNGGQQCTCANDHAQFIRCETPP